MKKKIISSILSLAMLLSLLPVAAFASGSAADNVDVTGYGFVWNGNTDNKGNIYAENDSLPGGAKVGSDWMGQTMYVALKNTTASQKNLWFQVTDGTDIWGCAATVSANTSTPATYAFSFLNRNEETVQWEQLPRTKGSENYATGLATGATVTLKVFTPSEAVTSSNYTTVALGDPVFTQTFTIPAVSTDKNGDLKVATLNVAAHTGEIAIDEAAESHKSDTDIQRNITVTPDASNAKLLKVSGTSLYVTGYTEFSSIASEQEGNYVALKLTAAETISIRKNNAWVTLDDGIIVVKLDGPSKNKIDVALGTTTSTTTADYTIDLTGVTKMAKTPDATTPTVIGMGFEAKAADAEAAISKLGGNVTDCEANTMFIRYNGLDNEKEYKVVFTDAKNETVYDSSVKAGGAADSIKNTKTSTVYFTFTGNGSVPVNGKTLASGDYTANLQVKNGDKWDPVTVEGAKTITIAKVTVGDKSAFFNASVPAASLKTVGQMINDITDATPTDSAKQFFAGWKTGAAAPITTAALNAVKPTTDVIYTAAWTDIAIDTTKDTTLTLNSEPVNGINVKVVNGADNKGTITLSGAISGLTTTAATYAIKYTTNAPNAVATTAEVKLKLDGTAVATETAKITVGAYEYTVVVTGLTPLADNVKIGDAGASTADVAASAAFNVGDSGKDEATLKSEVKTAVEKTTAEFTTNNENLANELKTEATKLTKESAAKLITDSEDIDAVDKASYTKIEVVPFLDIEVAGYDHTAQTLTLNVDAYVGYQAVKADGSDPVPVGTPKKMDDQQNIGLVTISFKKPTFVSGTPSNGDTLYVTHKDLYEYVATYSGTTYSFENPHGFSQFVVRAATDACATTETGRYMTLQAAVNDADNNTEITILKAGLAPVSVNEAIVLKLKTTDTTNITLTYLKTLLTAGNNVECAVTDNTTDTVTFTFTAKAVTPPSGGSTGGGGVSSNVTIDRPANGKVSVTPTAPSKGATVTINLTPDTGYTVGTVTVTDKDGKAVELTKVNDTQYTFTMPDGKVTVKATFTKVDAPATGFTDVPADAYYADAVKWAVDKGITNGLTATTFGPNNSCTRGQMVTFLWRAAGSPAATGTNSFSDVASGEYYYNAVLWAVEKGITNGTSATTFSPNATVNRGQTVTFLYRYAESPAATGDTSFTDVAADAFYADAVKWAVAEEITNGTSSTTFSPASNCTRGQIVTFMYRQMAE